MRHLICAMCCAAGVALLPTLSPAQNLPYDAYAQRPEPPMETSIPVVAKPPSAEQRPAAPIPAARHKISAARHKKVVHHIARVAAGPVTIPSPEVLALLLRNALAAVNQANFTENYSVLLGMMTPAQQTRLNESQLARAFAGLRRQSLDLSPALVISPQFVTAPSLTPEHVLRLKGFFPSRPLQIDFAVDYRAVDGYWLIDDLSVTFQGAAMRSDADLGAEARTAQNVKQ